MYDVIIIGGGPSAVAAGVYIGRKQLHALLVTESFGGQSIVSDSIGNWIGEKEISGVELASKLEAHVRDQETVTIQDSEKVLSISKKEDNVFLVVTGKGEYVARSVIIASGSRRKRLSVPGEDKYEGKGVAYCSTCDAPLFKGKDVAVVGGGNAGLEAVVDLFPYARKIYILNRGEELGGDPITQKQIFDNRDQVQIIHRSEVLEIYGESMMTGMIYRNLALLEDRNLDVQGVFVEIGSVPNSEIAKGLVDINKYGEIVINHKTMQTSEEGIFAAGDVTDELYKQNNISVGHGIEAALSAYNYLLSIEKKSPAEEV